MMRITLIITLLSFSIALNAQENFRVSGTNVMASKKPPQKMDRFEMGPLKWSSVYSKCAKPGGFEIGAWFTYKPKVSASTFTLKTGDGWGSLKEPVLYIGTIIENKGREILREVKCEAGTGNSEIVISLNDLEPKKEYFILVASRLAKKGDQCNTNGRGWPV
ncbi:MAG TPA: hypothetical protein DCX14_13385 [Flavobacteriales bacterium]|nr:hypothetical protein [Flavobacteriales bacterium]